GVALAGAQEECGKVMMEYARRQGGTEEAVVLGAGFRAPAALAALANGTMAHALDYDDINRTMFGHPSAPLLPTVLALGERESRSGVDVLAAFVVGFEVETKLRMALGPDYSDDLGWHPTAPLAAIGCAAAAARLLGLDVNQTAMTLSLAASQASGLRGNFGTMTKPFHVGHSARSGIVSADLVALGFTASDRALEHRYGFLNAFSGMKGWDGSRIEGKLGQPWDIVQPGIAIKNYPCCGSSHRALDAILALIASDDIKAEDVEFVDCQVSFDPPRSLIHSNPQTGLEGKFSMEYCVAAALLDKRITLGTFEDDQVQRPEIRRLMQLVKMRRVPGDEGQPTWSKPEEHVVVHLKGGRQLRYSVHTPKGEGNNPLSDEEVRNKYRDTAGRALPSDLVERTTDLIGSLETVANVRQLADLLARTAAPAGVA
ncbi:MAG: MmgE/PrpD family protein, partial [Chloroflexi bacterium]|nr:MmgE/PrpD family protein [Chloroflexota bacterium]